MRILTTHINIGPGYSRRSLVPPQLALTYTILTTYVLKKFALTRALIQLYASVSGARSNPAIFLNTFPLSSSI